MPESKDLSLRPALWCAAALLVLVVFIDAILWMVTPRAPHLPPVLPATGAPPRLQAEPEQDLARLRRREEAATRPSYEWADRAQGVIRLPIERAMTITAEEGGTVK